MLAYLFLGEVSIGRKRSERMREVLTRLRALPPAGNTIGEDPLADCMPLAYRHLFELGRSISGFAPVSGNVAHLLADSNAAIDSMVVDIDAAVDHVHLLFYIWLPDRNGLKIVEALRRAACRGVTCRAMADALGSRSIIGSRHWKEMQSAGVRVAAGLPIVNPLLRPLQGPCRPAQSPQDPGHRRRRHLLRQPELRRS
jgi:cardiolipin synthase